MGKPYFFSFLRNENNTAKLQTDGYSLEFDTWTLKENINDKKKKDRKYKMKKEKRQKYKEESKKEEKEKEKMKIRKN